MSISGRISIDAIFHDTDSTASINVVSHTSSTKHTIILYGT
jgi:hypothetical protein